MNIEEKSNNYAVNNHFYIEVQMEITMIHMMI